MGYASVFGSGSINPANRTHVSLSFSADVTLAWPIEQQIGGDNIAADIVDLDATNSGLNVDLSDARQVSEGFTGLYNNIGSNTVTIRDSAGGTIISLANGAAWFIYLVDNSTAAGTWRTFQLGASVSVASASALAGAGMKAIATTLNLVVAPTSTAVTPKTFVDADRAKFTIWTGGAGVFNMPVAATVGSDWYTMVRNDGSGNLTLTPTSGTIDGSATLVLSPAESAIVVTDGSNWFTIGRGTSSVSVFDFISINVAGSGDFTLSGVQLNRISYEFTGILTGNRSIIVPSTTQQYWVDNKTTGAFTLDVKTAAQITPIVVLQDNRNILYCDGTDVVDAESSTVSFPIVVTQGGTGAVTIGAAQTNLQVPPTGRDMIAGQGMTGGGTLASDRTFNVIGGDGITANADDIEVDATVLRTSASVGALTDVTLTGPAVGEFLRHNGAGQFINTLLVAGDIPSLDASDIGSGTFVAARIPTHTGQVDGQTALSLTNTAISAQVELTSGLLSTDELMVNDGGSLKRMDISVLEALLDTTLTFAATAHTHTGSTISDLDAADTTTGEFVAARIPTHTGDVTGQTGLVVQPGAITGKPALTSGLADADELLVSDAGVLKKMDISVMIPYFDANLMPTPAAHTHAAGDIDADTLGDARIAESNVTQHEAALTILESQITDGSILARLASNETISGLWTHSGRLVTDDSTTSRSGLNVPIGIAPTSPVQGDVWSTLSGFIVRLNGVSVDLAAGGAEVNNLSLSVTWTNIPDAFVPASAVTQHEATIDHDLLQNYVGTQHTDHAGVDVVAGNGLIGGGAITSSRTLDVVGGDGITANANDIEVDSTVLRTSSSINDLSDVAIAGAAVGEFLRWGGAAWADALLVEADIPSLGTAKIGSGTFADGRIAVGNVTQHVASINHDALLNYQANDHIDHATLDVFAGNGLTGGGVLTSDVTLTVVGGDGITALADSITVDSTVVRTTRDLIAGVGLSGGGTLASNRTFTLALTELGIETSIASGDFIAMVDITDSGSQKITFANFEGTISHANITGVVANQHIDMSTIQVNAGNGMTGVGATLTADVTLNVVGGDGITANANDITVDSTVVRTTRTVTAGNGLTGGGALSSNITLQVVGGDGITANANDITVDSTVIRTTGAQTLGGQKTFTTHVRAPAGSAAAPSYATTDTDTGWLSGGTNIQHWSCGNNIRMTLSAAGALVLDGDVTAFSDERLKTDLKVIPDALAKIMQLNGYTFMRKDHFDTDTGESLDTRRHAGVLAQEVQKVLPEVISESDDGILGTAYGNMAALFIEAIKELEGRVNRLEVH